MEDAPENSCELHDAEDALLFDDNLAISVEELNAFLDEESQIPPSSDARSQVTFDGAHLGKPDVTVDPANASKSIAGFRKFDEAVGSQWSTPSFCDVTDSKNEVNLGFSLGSAESFNCHLFPTSSNISHASEHADTKSTLACPSNWFSLSNQEYDLGPMKDLVGSYHDSLMGTDFHNQQAEYISGHSFDTAGGTGPAFSGYAVFHRDLYLDSGQKEELKRAKEYTPCADDSSHTLMTELSSLTDSERHDDRRATRTNSLLHDRSLHPYSSMVPNSSYLNLMNSNSHLNYTDTTNVMYNASGSSYLSCGGSSIDHSKNGLWNTLNHQFPQLIVKRKDEIEDHLHPFSSNSVVELDSRMESTGSLLQDFPMEDIVEPFIDLCTEQNHLDDVSLKSESSIDSSPLPSSRNSTSDDAHVFSVDESEELFPDALANLQNTQKKTTLRFERGIQVHVSQYQQNTLLRHSEIDGLKGNCAINYVNVDDDLDICIIDDIRNPTYPPPRPPSLLDVDNHTMLEQSGFTDTYHPRFGGMRYKADDEKLTFRLMLQDLAQPNSNSEANPPEGVLTIPLLRHQRIALHWMVQKETASPHCCGGILADDQGLGKTVSTIALILTERSPSPSPFTSTGDQGSLEALNLDDEDDDDNVSETNGTKQLRICSSITTSLSKRRENSLMAVKSRPAAGTLVVCPTSVLRQWAEELKTKVASIANLSYLVYHGGSRTKDPNELAKYDVVLTTYAIVSMEVPKQPLGGKDDEEKLKADGIMGHTTDKKRKDSPCSTSKSSKNGNKKDCSLLESAARPLARVRWFRVILDEAQSIKNHRTQVARACWGLRAKRRWCLSGTPIQNAVDDLYSYFRFLRYDPYAVYKSFCSLIKIPISRNPANGYKKLQVLLKTIMLRRTKGSMLDGEPIINLPTKTVILKKVDFSEEERTFYTRLEAESREQFKVYANEGTVKQNYVNILLMLLRLRQACDHRVLVNGYGSNFLGRSSVEMVKKLTKEKQKDLLSCLDARYAICTICNDPPEDAVVTICGHVFCNQCICELLNGDDSICPSAECKVRLDAASVFSRHTLVTSISDMPGELCHSTACGFDVLDEVKVSRDSYSSKVKAAIEILQSLPRSQWSQNCNSVELKEEGQLQNGVKVSLGGFVDSNDRKKSDMTCQPSEKAIVFSQWTRMLDLLEVPLKDSCIQYRRLDGTMSVAAREKAIKDFNNIPEVTVMIMSLKAASLGLNLVVACHVLLLDLWWNPTTEDQAIDRAHRIGQRRPVTVSRLTVKDTVEDRILALQEKKREMVASAFGEDESGSRQTRLTVEDLNYLFMV